MPLLRHSFGLIGTLFLGWLLAVHPAAAEVRLSGASTMLPVVTQAADAFFAQTGIRIRATGGGSDQGEKDVLSGNVQISMVSRELTATQPQRLVAHTMGLDGVAVFVNELNPVRNLKHAQVTAIFAGEINRWEEISQPGTVGRIVRIGKWPSRSTRGLFDGFFNLSQVAYPADTQMMGADMASILYVAIDPLSIAYVSIGTLEQALRAGTPVKMVSIAGVSPSRDNLASGHYHYRRPLNLVTRGPAQGEAKKFIDWLRSPAGQRLVFANGFLPVGPTTP